MNIVILSGRLGKQPETKTLEGGTVVSKFTLATSKKFKNKSGETVENTQWHNLICFGKLAELCDKYLSKGKEISVTGEITYREYTDKNDSKRYMTEIIVNEVHFHGSKEEGQKTASKSVSDDLPEPDPIEQEPGEDLPF